MGFYHIRTSCPGQGQVLYIHPSICFHFYCFRASVWCFSSRSRFTLVCIFHLLEVKAVQLMISSTHFLFWCDLQLMIPFIQNKPKMCNASLNVQLNIFPAKLFDSVCLANRKWKSSHELESKPKLNHYCVTFFSYILKVFILFPVAYTPNIFSIHQCQFTF